jgi:hypothetical protein
MEKKEIEELAIKECPPCNVTDLSYFTTKNLEEIWRLGFIEGYSQALQQPKWIEVNDGLPKDGEVYDIVCWWEDNHKQEERKGYIFKSKHWAVDWINFFQQKGFYDSGLYEESFGLDENIITHYRLHDPLPSPPTNSQYLKEG